MLSISFVSMSSQSVNCIYPFELFHQLHIFCSKDLSRSAITLYGYYVCSCNFGTTRLLHARFLYSAYVLSNHISKLYSYLLSGFLSNFNTCSLGSGNPCREKHPRKKDSVRLRTMQSWEKYFSFDASTCYLSQSVCAMIEFRCLSWPEHLLQNSIYK